jgi:hypothetical protein
MEKKINAVDAIGVRVRHFIVSTKTVDIKVNCDPGGLSQADGSAVIRGSVWNRPRAALAAIIRNKNVKRENGCEARSKPKSSKDKRKRSRKNTVLTCWIKSRNN